MPNGFTECRCGCVRDRVEDVVVCPDFRCQGEPTPSEHPERVLRRGRGVEDVTGYERRATVDEFLVRQRVE